MDKIDAFDVITDPELTSRTTNLKRAFALKLAAQVVHDAWYDYEDPEDLEAAIKNGSFTDSHRSPEAMMEERLLHYSGSIDAKTLDVLRDVGVGAPQVGAIGVGAQVTTEKPAENTAPKHRVFGK